MNCKERIYWIDALKFLSMVVVFLSHLRMTFFVDKYKYIELGKFKITNYFFSGNLAVCIFLFISIFLFTQKTFNRQIDLKEIGGAIRNRYFRLFIPACIVNILILIFYCLGLFYNGELSKDLPYVHDWFNFRSIFFILTFSIKVYSITLFF